MYLIRDRNSTYYCRIPVPQNLREKGFPHSLRISLKTKCRQTAIERNLVTAYRIKSVLKSTSPTAELQQWRARIDSEVEQLRNADFHQSNPYRKLNAKLHSCRNLPLTPNFTSQCLLKRFLATKRTEAIFSRSVDQLELRISHLIRFVGDETPVAKVSSRTAMSYRDALFTEGKSHKTVQEYLAANRQFFCWCVLGLHLIKNPFDGVKAGKKLIALLTANESA